MNYKHEEAVMLSSYLGDKLRDDHLSLDDIDVRSFIYYYLVTPEQEQIENKRAARDREIQDTKKELNK